MSGGRRLVLGLGNPLAGDDGIGSRVARRLLAHPRLPADAVVLECGTDLLRFADAMAASDRVILVDALLDPSAPGVLHRLGEDLDELEEGGGGVHALSPVEALRLLRCLQPALRSVPFVFLGITVGDVRISHDLSPTLAARLDGLVEEVLDVLEEASEVP